MGCRSEVGEAGSRFGHKLVEQLRLLFVERAEPPQPDESIPRIFGPILVEGGDGREPQRLAMVRSEDEGAFNKPGGLAFEPIAARPGKRFGFGEQLPDSQSGCFRRGDGRRTGLRIEPAGLPEQDVQPDREKRECDAEGEGGAPAGPRPRRVGPVFAGKVFGLHVSEDRTRNVVSPRTAGGRVFGRIAFAGIDFQKAVAVGGKRRVAAVDACGGGAAQEWP